MKYKLILFLIGIERRILQTFTKNKDDIAYEDCFYAIQKHERLIMQIEKEDEVIKRLGI